MDILYFSCDYEKNKIYLHSGDCKRELSENEIYSLVGAMSDYLAQNNLMDAVSYINATLGNQSTLIFTDTKKIHTVNNQSYGVSLGLFVENSQTAYNLHKSGRKCDR